jgi:hypothetical protein
MSKKFLVSIATVFLLVFGAVWFWSNKYTVYDFITLRGYSPTPQIEALAQNSGMSDKGKKIFYVNDPRLSDRQEFANECESKEQTIVLGCYTGKNIFVFDVTDDRLAGVEEVTSAHEMLHAAYDRLSVSEKNKVDGLTAEAFQRMNNPRINSLIENYRKADPSVVPNELHSILGTEVENLGPELEQYYSKYFIDRKIVVSKSQSYEKVLSDINSQVDKYKADLTLRKAEIENSEAALLSLEASINTLKKRLDGYSSSGQVSSYNSLVPEYNRLVNSYNAQYNEFKSLLVQYNNIVEQVNLLVIEQNDLMQSLDSRVKSSVN